MSAPRPNKPKTIEIFEIISSSSLRHKLRLKAKRRWAKRLKLGNFLYVNFESMRKEKFGFALVGRISRRF